MLTVNKVAKATGVSADTVRYYESRGLIDPPARSDSGYRLFEEQVIDRVAFIKRAQGVGFTLTEIGALMNLAGRDEDGTEGILQLTKAKIDECRQKIEDLKEIERVLTILSDKCPGHGKPDACPILDYLGKPDGEPN